MLPMMTIENFEAKISQEDLDIAVYNSVDDQDINYVVGLFESTYLPEILNILNQEIPQIWNAEFERIMDLYGGVLPLTKEISLDLSYADTPFVSEEHLQIFLNANLVNATSGHYILPEQQPDMVIDQNSTFSLQFGLSAETINSALELLYDSGAFLFEIPSSQLWWLQYN